jgi:hypothetical protein
MAREKLAYVATISKLNPIEGKDRILYASFDSPERFHGFFQGFGWRSL